MVGRSFGSITVLMDTVLRHYGYGYTQDQQVDLLLGRPLNKAQTRDISIQMHLSISRHRSSFVYTVDAVAFAGGQLSQLPSVTYCGLWPIKCRKGSEKYKSNCWFWEKLTIGWFGRDSQPTFNWPNAIVFDQIDIQAQTLGPAGSFSHFPVRPAYMHLVLSRLRFESCMTPWCCPWLEESCSKRTDLD
jgi:hypothetical protein